MTLVQVGTASCAFMKHCNRTQFSRHFQIYVLSMTHRGLLGIDLGDMNMAFVTR